VPKYHNVFTNKDNKCRCFSLDSNSSESTDELSCSTIDLNRSSSDRKLIYPTYNTKNKSFVLVTDTCVQQGNSSSRKF